MTKNTQAKRLCFVGYCRVSTHHQEDKVSLESQADQLKRYCESQGFDLIEVLSEVESAFRTAFEKRPQGKKAIEMIRNGEADGIIAIGVDRAFRSLYNGLTSLDRLRKQNIRFICIDSFNGKPLENLPNSAEGQLEFHMKLAFAQYQRDQIAEKTSRALRLKQKQGFRVGRPPYGFKIEGGRLVEDPEEMKNIVSMKRSYKRGQTLRSLGRKYGLAHSTVAKLVRTDLRLLRKQAQAKKTAKPSEEQE